VNATYKAVSLEDIALMFDQSAESATKASKMAGLTALQRAGAQREAATWRQAAHVLRNTELAAPEERDA
jgi:hypothetical protein